MNEEPVVSKTKEEKIEEFLMLYEQLTEENKNKVQKFISELVSKV